MKKLLLYFIFTLALATNNNTTCSSTKNTKPSLVKNEQINTPNEPSTVNQNDSTIQIQPTNKSLDVIQKQVNDAFFFGIGVGVAISFFIAKIIENARPRKSLREFSFYIIRKI